MKFIKQALVCAVIGSACFGTLQAQAATKTLCETEARPAGYLTVELNIANGSCPTKKSTKYSTPSNGLTILLPMQLEGLSPPYVVTALQETPTPPKYTIREATDGIVACAVNPFTPYGYFSVSHAKLGACGKVVNNLNNSVKLGRIMYTEIARPTGRAGEVRVQMNSANPEKALTYSIRTTAALHGGQQTVGKTLLSGSKSYTLKDIAPDFLDEAAQGAAFTFVVEAFTGTTSVAKDTLTATGAEMIKN